MIILHGVCNILYWLFNAACLVVFAYEGYLWMRSDSWTKIPALHLVPDSVARWETLKSPDGVGPVLHWLLTIDLAYSLGGIALVFYLIRWVTSSKVK